MARARSLSAYPPVFAEIMERVGVRQDTITQSVLGHRAAMRLQGKFYAYRQAVKRELALAKLKGAEYTPEQVEALINLWQWVQVTVCWFDRNSPPEGITQVSFMHRDKTPEALLLRQMLDANPITDAPQSTANIDASLGKLLDKLGATAPTKKYY